MTELPIIVNTNEVTVGGVVDQVELQLSVGAQGERGSRIFSGNVSPLTLPVDSPYFAGYTEFIPGDVYIERSVTVLALWEWKSQPGGYTWVQTATISTGEGGSGYLDADLEAIAALTGTNGLLRKTATNTWVLDTNSYLTSNQSITLSGDVTGTGTSSITTTVADDSHSHTSSTISALDAGDTTTGTFNIARIPTGTTGTTVALGNHTHSGYQAADNDLTAIAAISGTGYLRRTGVDTWTLDTPATATWGGITGTLSSQTDLQNALNAKQAADNDLTAIAALAGTSGFLKKTATDTWALDTNTYLTSNQTITLSGDASGSGTTAITVTVADDSHAHTASTISALDAGDTTTGTFNIARIPTGSTGSTVALGNHTHSYQPVDADLTAIAALAGTSGFLKKTATDTWTLDTTSYAPLANPTFTGTVALPSTTTVNGVSVSSYFKDGDFVMNTNPFGGRRLYINSINDALFLADKRWSVTGTFYRKSDNANMGSIGAGSLAVLFDGDYENSLQVPLGQYAVITIDFSGTTYFPGYPYGYFYVSHYYVNRSESASMRVYCNYAPHGIGWHTLTFESIVDNGSDNLIRRAYNGKYQISAAEFTIASPDSGNNAWITQIELQLNRPSAGNEMPLLDKYRPNTIYKDFTVATGANVVLPSTTTIGSVSSTELGYLDGVTSAIQTQLGTKAPSASPTFTGVPAAPTAAADTNTTQLATTAYVIGQGYLKTSTAASTYQPLDGDLTSIAGLAGTSGFAKKTSANTWTLDTNTYLTGNQSITLSGDATGSGTTAITVAVVDDSHSHTGTTISSLDAGDTTTGIFDIARIPTGSTGTTVSLGNHTHSYQPVDADLSAIAALTGTGYLQRTGADTWALGAGGTGDVVGPSSATASAFALFNGTTGKLIKNSGFTTYESGTGIQIGYGANDPGYYGENITPAVGSLYSSTGTYEFDRGLWYRAVAEAPANDNGWRRVVLQQNTEVWNNRIAFFSDQGYIKQGLLQYDEAPGADVYELHNSGNVLRINYPYDTGEGWSDRGEVWTGELTVWRDYDAGRINVYDTNPEDAGNVVFSVNGVGDIYSATQLSLGSTYPVTIIRSNGNPHSVLGGNAGSLALDYSYGRMYINETGGSTGWQRVPTQEYIDDNVQEMWAHIQSSQSMAIMGYY